MKSGIWGYGVGIPRLRITAEEIHRVWKNLPFEAVKVRGVKERAVVGPDEDTVTLSSDAVSKALKMSGLGRRDIGALILGTQTSPYHTRPAASIRPQSRLCSGTMRSGPALLKVTMKRCTAKGSPASSGT